MATAAAITSTSSSSISNVVTSQSTTSNTAILSLGSSALSSNVTNIGPDAISIGPISVSAVASSTSRSRRSNKTSQHHHSSSGSSSTFSANDAKPNHTSSSSTLTSKSASHSSASLADSHIKSSKSGGGQRKWKDESTTKSSKSSFKLKTTSSLCTDSIGEVFSSSRPLADDRRKWKSIDKYKAGNSSLYKMKGLKWRAFAEQMLDNDGKEIDRRKNRKEKGLVRLDQSDMSLFGFCPEQDQFYAVVCDICHAAVKPQGLRKHVSHRHVNIHGHHHTHSHRHLLNYDSITGRSTTNHFGLSSSHAAHNSLATTQLASAERISESGSDKLLSSPTRGLYNMKGLKWKTFTEQMIEGDGNKTDSRKNRKEGGMVRLDQSDMCVYGFCPEQDPFYTVLCDICNMAVKPQGLRKHVSHRHIVDIHGHHHAHTHRHLLNYIGVAADRSSDHFGLSSQTSAAAVAATIASTTPQSAASERPSEKISSTSSNKPIQSSEALSNHGLLSQQLSSRSSAGGVHSSSSSSNSSKSKSKSLNKVKSKSGRSSHSSSAHSSSSGISSVGGISTPNGISSTNGVPPSNSPQANSCVSYNANSSSTALPRSSDQGSQKQLRAPNFTSSSSTYTSATTHTTFPLLSGGTSSAAKASPPSKQSSGGVLEPSSNIVDGAPPQSSSSSSSVSSSSSSSSAADSTTPRRTYGRCNKSLTERILSTLYRHMVKEREYDANKHCGVVSSESSRPCTRSLTCKAHSLSLRRMVSGRSKSFDKLLADHRAAKDSQSRAIPDLESSNSSSSIDLDRRSVSSNSNLSVEVQASSTASSQSSIAAAGGAEAAAKLPQAPTASSSVAPKSSVSVPDPSHSNGTMAPSLPTRTMAPLIEDADLPVTESVETVRMGESDNSIQININPDGTTQSTFNVNRRAAQSVGQTRRRSSEEPHQARVTTRVLDRARVNVPPELLDDSKFSTNIFSPESTVLSGPIRLLADDDNYSGGAAKRVKNNPEPEVDMSNMSEESKLQLMVQRKVHKKNKILFRDPNQPSPSAITVPPAAEIVAQAFAEENPSATLTDAQVIMDPETSLVSISVCGRLNPDNMQLNWAPFNQEFIDNTLSQALSPYGITVTTAPTPAQSVQTPALMPNPEEEGIQIHHLPPLTEEEYNQMRPEFINGMPKPRLMGCPAIKSEIKEETEDCSTTPMILPQIKQEGIKQEIKVEIKEEPLEEDAFDTENTPPQSESVQPMLQQQHQEASLEVPQICVSAIDLEEQTFEEWPQHDGAVVTTSEALSEISSPPSPNPRILDFDDSSDDESCIDVMQPITTSTGKSSPEASSSANEKENSGESGRYSMRSSLYGSDGCGYRNGGIGSSRNGYYSRLPKPNNVNTFGLVKFRGRANFKKSIICTRRTNSSIQAYQALFQNHGTLFRRDSVNTLGSIHCTVDSNGAISLNGGNSSFEHVKNPNLSSPGGVRTNNTIASNSAKNIKQTRRQNSGNSPSNSQTLKRQPSYLISPTSIQTPPSNPFYKRSNVANSGNRPQVHKRSIIMHFRGNGAGPQHLSKTCAILQSQIVHKLAEQLLGFKKTANNNLKPSAAEQSSSVGSSSKAAVTQKQQLPHHHSSSSNSKLPSSSSSVTTLMYKSNTSSGGNTSSSSNHHQASASKPTPIAASSSSASGPSPTAQQSPKNNSNNNTMKVPRVTVKLSPAAAAAANTNLNGKDMNAVLIRNHPSSNNTVTQRYTTTSAPTPVAIVAPILSSTPPSTPGSSSMMSTGYNNSMMMPNGSNGSGSSSSVRGHNGLSSVNGNSSGSSSSGGGGGASFT